MASTSSKTGAKSGKPKSEEEIMAGFQALRAEQRQIANKISELHMDLGEHRLVVEALEGVDGSRKCFRMVGGVLVERTVAEILPELKATKERLPAAVQALNEQLTKKGNDIVEYMQKYDLRMQRDTQNPPPQPQQQAKPNVLVS